VSSTRSTSGRDPPPLAGHPFLDPRVAGLRVTLDDAPPPISGGTLRVAEDAPIAIVSDPDRDRILAVDLVARRVLGATAHLPPGAEPGRIAEGPTGLFHVALRGSGEIYTFDPESIDAGTRRSVCPMPRGIAYDGATGQVVVACRGGELVRLPAAGGAPTSIARVAPDLRDVVLTSGRLFVTTFRHPEVIELDADGTILARTTADDGLGISVPTVAWRTIETGSRLAMVHQRAADQEVPVTPGGYGDGGGMRSFCDVGIVAPTVTMFGGGGGPIDPLAGRVGPFPISVAVPGPLLSGATLPVDIAATRDGSVIAVIAAGNQSGSGAVLIYDAMRLASLMGPFECLSPSFVPVEPVSNAVAAAFTNDDVLLVQSRDPARLAVVDLAGSGAVGWIDLGGEPRFDTGHAIFHGNSGSTLACASCHPEGGDDGRTWTFGGIGARRTPAMHGDLRGTEPFHWDGDMRDLAHLMDDVFTGRMSGPRLDPARVDALGAWLDELPAPVASPARDAEAAARGRALFYGEAACAACHAGALLTNNATVDVGTGGAFQVPSLIGVSARLPVMHDGCATTLRARFEPACGGAQHGNVAPLGSERIDALVAFLETL
jgi:hypothetical protein